MIVKKSPEIIKAELAEKEMDLLASSREKDRQREFELEKVRIESTVPQRWTAFKEVVDTIFTTLSFVLFMPFLTILLLCKVDIPDFIKDLYAKKR